MDVGFSMEVVVGLPRLALAESFVNVWFSLVSRKVSIQVPCWTKAYQIWTHLGSVQVPVDAVLGAGAVRAPMTMELVQAVPVETGQIGSGQGWRSGSRMERMR